MRFLRGSRGQAQGVLLRHVRLGATIMANAKMMVHAFVMGLTQVLDVLLMPVKMRASLGRACPIRAHNQRAAFVVVHPSPETVQCSLGRSLVRMISSGLDGRIIN